MNTHSRFVLEIQPDPPGESLLTTPTFPSGMCSLGRVASRGSSSSWRINNFLYHRCFGSSSRWLKARGVWPGHGVWPRYERVLDRSAYSSSIKLRLAQDLMNEKKQSGLSGIA